MLAPESSGAAASAAAPQSAPDSYGSPTSAVLAPETETSGNITFHNDFKDYKETTTLRLRGQKIT